MKGIAVLLAMVGVASCLTVHNERAYEQLGVLARWNCITPVTKERIAVTFGKILGFRYFSIEDLR